MLCPILDELGLLTFCVGYFYVLFWSITFCYFFHTFWKNNLEANTLTHTGWMSLLFWIFSFMTFLLPLTWILWLLYRVHGLCVIICVGLVRLYFNSLDLCDSFFVFELGLHSHGFSLLLCLLFRWACVFVPLCFSTYFNL